MFERYTENARRTIFFAFHEAGQSGSGYIEPEHILLGLLQAEECLAQLLNVGVTDIRNEFERGSPPREGEPRRTDMPLSASAQRVLAFAARESEMLQRKHIGTEHLLLGLALEQTPASAVLCKHGLDASNIREALTPGA